MESRLSRSLVMVIALLSLMGMPSSRAVAMPRVLVVDDYADAVAAWTFFLHGHGCDVLSATDGIAAVEVATRELPDIVVLDLDLPGRHGMEVAEILRQDSRTARIPLIAMTGDSHQSKLARAKAGRFDVVHVKPCHPETLLSDILRLTQPLGRRGDGLALGDRKSPRA